MGTWSIKINGNDAFLDVYAYFFNLYNQGKDPGYITIEAKKHFEEMQDKDDENFFEYLYAIALAQWETKSLDPIIYKQVKDIIENGEDNLLRETIHFTKRQKVLEKFFAKISTEKEKPKRRVKPKVTISSNPFVTIKSPDKRKTFVISQQFIEGESSYIIGTINWGSGSSSIFYFTQIGKYVSAQWLDDQTLEIIHDRTIVFQNKEHKSFFAGNSINIQYKIR